MVSSSSCHVSASTQYPSRASRRRGRLRRTAVLSSARHTFELMQSFRSMGFEQQLDIGEGLFPRPDAPEFVPLTPFVDHIHDLLVGSERSDHPPVSCDGNCSAVHRRQLQETWTAEALPLKPVPSNTVIVLQPLTMPSVDTQTLDLFGQALPQAPGRRELSDTQLPTVLRTPETPATASQIQPRATLDVPEASESASIDIGNGIMASSPILHRYLQIFCDEGPHRGHVFDMIPALAPLPEHVCVRFCGTGPLAGHTYRWFRHDHQRRLLCDASGEYRYSLDGPPVRTSVSVAYILNQRLGQDQYRHHTAQMLKRVMCPETPENFDQCLRDMCEIQQTTSTSMLAYGMLRSARCESSTHWLEYLACACDFVAAVRKTGDHGSCDAAISEFGNAQKQDTALVAPAGVDAAAVTQTTGQASAAVGPAMFQQAEFVRISGGDLRGEKGYIAGQTRDGRWGIALLSGGCAFACGDHLERAKRPRRTKDAEVCSMVETARRNCTVFL